MATHTHETEEITIGEAYQRLRRGEALRVPADQLTRLLVLSERGASLEGFILHIAEGGGVAVIRAEAICEASAGAALH
jgi:hypothetical protein